MATVAAPGETAAAGGIPQLDVATFPNQIFWLLITLAVIYFILSRIALPRIGAVLAERRGTITNDLVAAEELKLKAEEAEGVYNKALADARTEAGRIITLAQAEIRAELDLAMAKADAEIAAQSAESEQRIGAIRENALSSVTEVAREAARDIVTAFGAAPDDAMISAGVARHVEG